MSELTPQDIVTLQEAAARWETTGVPPSLHFEQDHIVLDSMGGPVPDPSWQYRDHQGHQHAWQGRGIPSCRLVIASVDPYDDYETKEYVCRICEEVIQPGTLWEGAGRSYAAGLTYYFLGERPISEHAFLALYAADSIGKML